MHEKKAIFLTHEKTLAFDAKVSGGVQLCSREFYELMELSGFQLRQVNVSYTRRISQRIAIKWKVALYAMFDIKKGRERLFQEIEKHKIEYLFINMSSLLRWAKPVKLRFGDNVKIYLLSHGNDSGDFLHLTTNPMRKYHFLSKLRDIVRLGYLVHVESLYRKKYLDGVFSVSNTEREIENWFGAKTSIFVPRTINKEKKLNLRTNYSRIGFIGRLDHPPNYQGITMVLEEIEKMGISNNMDFRLIGAPVAWGKRIMEKYAFVQYLGELSDEAVEEEVSTWAAVLNTVFWYSTGVTTKFAKYLEWGVPIITTLQGVRGYQWSQGSIDYVTSPKEMAKRVAHLLDNKEAVENLKKEQEKIKASALTLEELSEELKKELF